MTTQSPYLYQRQARPGGAAARGSGKAADPQIRLPWWALALPVAAFATLLTLLSGGPAHASTAASGGDLAARLITALGALVHHLL